MQYTRLGRTGLEVSRICLGCMSFGEAQDGHHEWTLDEEASRLLIERALDGGVTFFDTANVYSNGSSEEIVGRALRDMANRDEIVVATKLYAPMRKGRNAIGLSRKSVMTEVDASLRRLGLDYIDLYQIHRWDPDTPIEETLEALNDVVRSGKVRYIGASSMWTWQFSKALYTAELRELTPFVSMQNHYNLLNREEEREMLPLCVDRGIGVLPWSPLARGRLAREWNASTTRSQTDRFHDQWYDTSASDREIVDVVGAIANERAAPRAQVALAWVLSNPTVTAPIVGATKSQHVDDALAALDLELTSEELERLEAPYTPHPVVGFQ